MSVFNLYGAWKLAQPLANMFADIEDDLMVNIARRLAENGDITDTAKWELQMLAKMGALQKDNVRIIAQRAGIAPELLEIALTNAAQDAIDTLEPGFKQLAKEGFIKNTRITPNHAIRQAVTAYWKQARDSLNMVNTVMQYKVKKAWQKIVRDTAELANKQEFLDILNKNTGAVVTGAQARQAAMRKTIKEFNERGIPGFVDKRGREWSPEAYVNMDIRTTVTNVAHEAQFARMDDYGLNLVQISSHSGARPKCAKDQGKIFDKGNKSGYVSDLYGKKIRYYPWSSSSYGEPDGILGINCGHFAYPFVPGVSFQRYFPTEDMAENDRLYKQSQKQRALERDIRSAKRECMMFDELGDKEQFEKSAVKLKNKRDKLNDFIQNTGRTKHSDREQVVGFDRSLSAKATAAQKRVAKRSDSGIIKLNDTIIGKSLGAKAKNYDIIEPDTGNIYHFVEGTR